MILSDRRVEELYNHTRSLIDRDGPSLGVFLNGSIPFLARDSKLLWYPTISPVCVSPIQEEKEETIDDDNFAVYWSAKRPIFYTEINAVGFNIVKKRWRIRRKRIIQLIKSNETSF